MHYFAKIWTQRSNKPGNFKKKENGLEGKKTQPDYSTLIMRSMLVVFFDQGESLNYPLIRIKQLDPLAGTVDADPVGPLLGIGRVRMEVV